MPRHATNTSFQKGHTPTTTAFKKGHISCFLGKRHTTETKAKMRTSTVRHFSNSKERLKQSEAQKQYLINHEHQRKGKRHTENTRLLISQRAIERLTNHKHPFKGKRHTESSRLLMSQRAIERFKRPEEIRKVLSSRRPTALEARLTDIITNHSLPYRYVGNGDLIIGGKNPDFMNINGAKKLIEVFGVHWHSIFDIGSRIEHFRTYGFDTLIIWEEELANEKAIIHKIRKFEKRKH